MVNRRFDPRTLAFILLLLALSVGFVDTASAGVGGAEFDDIYDKLVGWAQGTPGRIVWDRQGRETTVDAIAQALLAEPDRRVRDLGRQLYPFTRAGEYGRFFNGPNTVHLLQSPSAGQLSVSTTPMSLLRLARNHSSTTVVPIS